MPRPFSRAPRVRSLLLAAGLVALTGCAMTFDGRSLGVPAAMSAAAAEPIAGDSFAVTTRAIHALWGLYPVRQPSLQNVLAGQLAGGAGVGNLRITVHRGWSDLLISAVTLGIVNPTAVTFAGVIIPAPR